MRIECLWTPDFITPSPIILPQREGTFLYHTEAELSIVGEEAASLFNRFYQSPHWEEFMEKLYERPRATHILAGDLFELLAYFYLSSRLPEEQYLLPPSQTARLCQTLGLHESWKTAPDGIIFERDINLTKVLALCEYTLSSDRPRKLRQMAAYRAGGVEQSLSHPLAFAGLLHERGFLPAEFPPRLEWVGAGKPILYVVPSDSPFRETSSSLIEVIPFPIKLLEFHHFLDALIADSPIRE